MSHIKIFLFFVVTTLVFMSGCNGQETNKETVTMSEQEQQIPLQPYIEAQEQPGGKISIIYKASNKSKVDQTLSFTSGLQTDAILYDKSGSKIAQYSDSLLSTQAIQEVTLKPEEFIEQQFLFEDIPNGEYVIEAFLTAKEQQVTAKMNVTVQENTIKLGSKPVNLTSSPLEIDGNLLEIFNEFKQSHNQDVLADLEPFQIFQLYMYTQAGQDFKTLYHLYISNPDQVNVDTFVKESMNSTNVQNIDQFMSKFNEVREFTVVATEIDRAYVEFTLPGEQNELQFQLQKNENQIWQVLWMPLQ
ncbi:hypothetical protein FZW96_01020 [Bacillus sp. BGMRC 2118]|nr:hypothetical protein FZW96_01020 [Bacillus sp. BGMRC 2118]